MAARSGILGLGSRLYPGNVQRIFNKDLTRFMPSLSRECQNRASKRKALLAGCPQPSHEPPAPGPLRHPSHLSQIAQWKQNKFKKKKKKKKKKNGGDREGTPRTTKLLIRLTTPRQQSNKPAANTWDNNACTKQEYR